MNRNKRILRLFSGFLAFLLFVSTCFINAPTVNAYEDVEDLTVTVGYWGMDDYDKNKVGLSELASACGTHKEIYTWIDKKPATGTTEAEGIYIADLLDYFDIDQSEVYCYNFFTLDADGYAGATEQWTQSKLFGTRYSYKASFQKVLEEFLNKESIEDYIDYPEKYYRLSDFFDEENAKYKSVASNERVKVKPMLALSTYSTRWEGDYPAAYLDYSELSTSGNPQLLYGQTGLSDTGRSTMAKMVYKIHVWFEGSPKISVNSDSLEGEVGSTQKIEVSVETPDTYLTQMVKENLEWKSSDESVAVVDEHGNVTIVGEGEASVSISYGGKEGAAVGVASGTGTGNGTGSGSGDGTGDGTGTGSGTGNSGEGTGAGDDAQGNGGGEGSGEHKSEGNADNKTDGKNENSDSKTETDSLENGNADNQNGEDISTPDDSTPSENEKTEEDKSVIKKEEDKVSIKDKVEKKDNVVVKKDKPKSDAAASAKPEEGGVSANASEGGGTLYEYAGVLDNNIIEEIEENESMRWLLGAVAFCILVGFGFEVAGFRHQVKSSVSESDFVRQKKKNTAKGPAPEFNIRIPKGLKIALFVLVIGIVGVGGRLLYGPPVLFANITEYEDEQILITGLGEDFYVTPGELAGLDMEWVSTTNKVGSSVTGMGPTLNTFLAHYGNGVTQEQLKQVKFIGSDDYSTTFVKTAREQEIVLCIADGWNALDDYQKPLRIIVPGDSSKSVRMVTTIEFTVQ